MAGGGGNSDVSGTATSQSCLGGGPEGGAYSGAAPWPGGGPGGASYCCDDDPCPGGGPGGGAKSEARELVGIVLRIVFALLHIALALR
jgi:uncharacterized membrane protein